MVVASSIEENNSANLFNWYKIQISGSTAIWYVASSNKRKKGYRPGTLFSFLFIYNCRSSYTHKSSISAKCEKRLIK